MNHDKVKEILFDQDSNLRDEYNALQPIYEIRRQLIQYRIEQGLSQKELAEKVGTKQSAISRLESGEYNPSIAFLSKVAHALGKEIRIMIQ
ncbi:MAG: helix-turn-helix domain-containing protein [Bacillota bacterium]|jgi:DNA-binding XRE family transcriptional regulator|nr:helix-turn-helix domain-containing protein [Bacillota bacterium]NLV63371.1 helix-turn-helix domain-containing protein [Clostridiaceae bacterium]